MNPKALLVSCLLLASCGSGSQPDYSIKVFAVNVDCQFAEQVMLEAQGKFHAAGIPLETDLHCVNWEKSYRFGEKNKALSELSAKFGKGHFLVPKFGLFFDGVANSSASISVAVVGRLEDSKNQMTHEILHQFGASHIFEPCNVMGYYRACENPQILEQTLREIGL